jgi:hypothetical protein
MIDKLDFVGVPLIGERERLRRLAGAFDRHRFSNGLNPSGRVVGGYISLS